MQRMERVPPQGSPLVVIVGPTGSGKTTLALGVAESVSGEIVNCDSLQLYRGFDIGTAKIPPAQRGATPHHLFDVLDPQIGYSAGEYARAARAVLHEIAGRNRVPIVVGGTGFYLKALLEGLPPLPERDTTLRENLARREATRPGVLHRLLRRLDPRSATAIHSRDVQKLIRAVEVRVLTRDARPAPEVAEPLTGYRVLKLGLNPDRVELAAVLDQRTREMFERGLLDEVRGLLARGCSGAEKPFESLGYKQALTVVRGETPLEDAVIATQNETRQYAKRQRTWFRRDPEIRWFDGFVHSIRVIEQCAALVREFITLS
jgi:tRNA dimethylallyltransferase